MSNPQALQNQAMQAAQHRAHLAQTQGQYQAQLQQAMAQGRQVNQAPSNAPNGSGFQGAGKNTGYLAIPPFNPNVSDEELLKNGRMAFHLFSQKIREAEAVSYEYHVRVSPPTEPGQSELCTGNGRLRYWLS